MNSTVEFLGEYKKQILFEYPYIQTQDFPGERNTI